MTTGNKNSASATTADDKIKNKVMPVLQQEERIEWIHEKAVGVKYITIVGGLVLLVLGIVLSVKGSEGDGVLVFYGLILFGAVLSCSSCVRSCDSHRIHVITNQRTFVMQGEVVIESYELNQIKDVSSGENMVNFKYGSDDTLHSYDLVHKAQEAAAVLKQIVATANIESQIVPYETEF